MTVIKNAVIDKASVQLDREFILTVWLMLDFGGSGQGFGGYGLGGTTGLVGDHTGPNYAAEFITKCMTVAGVERWDDMRGKTIRVEYEDESYGAKITGIGHIIKDVWFRPEDAFAALKAGRK